MRIKRYVYLIASVWLISCGNRESILSENTVTIGSVSGVLVAQTDTTAQQSNKKPILKRVHINFPFEINCDQNIARLSNYSMVPDTLKQHHIYWFEKTEYGYNCLFKRFIPEEEYGMFEDDGIYLITFSKDKKTISKRRLIDSRCDAVHEGAQDIEGEWRSKQTIRFISISNISTTILVEVIFKNGSKKVDSNEEWEYLIESTGNISVKRKN